MSITIFLTFVAFVLGLSFYLGRKTKSAKGYFAAGGNIHWGVNGVAFAGDYLSAASFLGICGMIAFSGYDGFLYSIGYLAGWIVALFVVAEPMKRLGKFTFTDALDSKFNSKGIQLMAGISTLIVSLCYLIPQMVGAGVLVEPLLGVPHYWGVIMVGVIVIYIVATAGMASTTYVQFLKGGLLIIFSTVLAVCFCYRGLTTEPVTLDADGNEVTPHAFETLSAQESNGVLTIDTDQNGIAYTVIAEKTKTDKAGKELGHFVLAQHDVALREDPSDAKGRMLIDLKSISIHLPRKGTREKLKTLNGMDKKGQVMINGVPHVYQTIDDQQVLVLHDTSSVTIDGVKYFQKDGKYFAKIHEWYKKDVADDGAITLTECQYVAVQPNEGKIINGIPASKENHLRPVGNISQLPGGKKKTGGVGPFELLAIIGHDDTRIKSWGKNAKFEHDDDQITVYYPITRTGPEYTRPGLKFPLTSKNFMDKLNFISLMLALFFGTAALPHILIRYYTVPTPAAARKSTIVAIACIGFFYVLTIYLGMGATVSGVLNPETSNMSAPLFARSFGLFLFAMISALAFATVLGTVSGLIVASSGAVAHDLLNRYAGVEMTDKTKVWVGKLAAITVGLVAIILGIVFRGMNVSFLVGWAFAIAASANLPAILMLLFWKKTTAKGIAASIFVGIVAAIGIIMLGPDMFVRYGLERSDAIIALGQPGIISIPASFITLVVVSLLTQKNSKTAAA